MRILLPLVALTMALAAPPRAPAAEAKKRIFVISSYHKEYLWSQSTQRGLTASLLKHRYLDTQEQAERFTREDFVESTKAVLKKEWMDTKRRDGRAHIAKATQRIMKSLREFKPDLVMLGDDNATNYIGNQLLDTATPAVF